MEKTDAYVFLFRFADISVAGYEQLLDKKRLSRVLRCKGEASKEKIIKAGVGLYNVLEQYGVSPKDIGYDNNDKPYITGRDDLYFNLSHSGDYLLIAVSGQPLGVDIQKTVLARENVVKRILSFEETAEYSQTVSDNFKLVWAIKEAYSKLSGTGISIDFKEVSFAIDNLDVEYTFQGEKAYGKIVLDNEDYSAVVCTAIPLVNLSTKFE